MNAYALGLILVATFLPWAHLASCDTPIEASGPWPGNLLHLLRLHPKTVNVTLLQAVVECLDVPVGPKPSFATFSTCLHDQLHLGTRSILDSPAFVLGTYIIVTATKYQQCVMGSGPEECTRVLGECLPMVLRRLFGLEEYGFDCEHRNYLQGYDEADLTLDDDYMNPDY